MFFLKYRVDTGMGVMTFRAQSACGIRMGFGRHEILCVMAARAEPGLADSQKIHIAADMRIMADGAGTYGHGPMKVFARATVVFVAVKADLHHWLVELLLSIAALPDVAVPTWTYCLMSGAFHLGEIQR